MRSMTGFGRCEMIEGGRRFTVELKSVNHRYLDLTVRMPKVLDPLESDIRSLVKQYGVRGKMNLSISYENEAAGSEIVECNTELAGEYMNALQQLAAVAGRPNDVGVGVLSRYPDVLTLKEPKTDEKELWDTLKKALESAGTQFVASREAEGMNLKADIRGKLQKLRDGVAYIETRSPEIVEEYRKKLDEKMKELLEGTQIEENRIAAEVILFADKICTDEEVVRLKSHIERMEETMDAPGDIGKKLDFIAQEMNREANTILSKANDIQVSDQAIELKTEIEKIREQIQNIE